MDMLDPVQPGVAAPKGSHGESDAERPFGMVRYYSVTSLVIIALVTLVISTLVSMRTRDLVRAKRVQYSLLLAENLNHQVMTRFVEQVLRKYGGIRLSEPEQYKLMDAVVRNTIHSFQVSQVNILDLQGTIIYSTQPEYIARTGYDGPAFQTALAGGHVSILEPEPHFLEWTESGPRMLRTFIPLRDERRLTSELGPVKAVFEITLDVSDDFREVWLNQALIVSVLLGMMALLFLILRSIVSRGQGIIDSRTKVRKMLEEKLSQSERLASLGRMIAGVAHEIRNPLGIVRSTAEVLGNRVEPEHKPLTGVIVEECSRLNRVVTEFLDFARPQTPQLRPMAVEEVLQRNLAALEPEIERLGIKVVRKLGNRREVMGDSDLLYRAFLNILNNALQAMAATGGTLAVTTEDVDRDERRWVAVRVADTGVGLEPEAQGHLFDPFYTTKEQGSGLGLSIVNSIVNSHHGEIDITGVAGGALVEMLLPAVEED